MAMHQVPRFRMSAARRVVFLSQNICRFLATGQVPHLGELTCISKSDAAIIERITTCPTTAPRVLRHNKDHRLRQDHGGRCGSFHNYERDAEEVHIVGRVIWAARRI